MRVLLHLVLLGSIATAVAPVRVLAEPAQAKPAVDPAKAKVAKQYVDAGLAAQDSGDYDTAITFYSKAYQLVQHPLLIFNIAQAHRLAGHIEQALRLYDRYLAADPNGAQAQTVRDIIAEIEARKAQEARKVEQARKVEKAGKVDQAHKVEEARKVEATRKAEDARKVEDARKAEEARRAYALEAARAAEQKRAVDAAPSSQEPAQPGPSDRAPGRTLQLSGIATGAAGAASLLVGVGFGIHARSLFNELSQPDAIYSQAKVDSGERANTVAIVGLVGGTALVAAGATLYWLGHSQGQHQEGVTIAPMVSDHLAGLVLSGSMP